MNEYKITMPEGWKPRSCTICIMLPQCIAEVSNGDNTTRVVCPLSHAVPVKEVEPLAVLADRKGFSSIDTVKVGPVFSIRIKFKTGGFKIFEALAYEACEQSASAYLKGLEDVKGGK